MPLAEIFKSPTIRGIAQYIKEAGKEKCAVIESVEKKEYYEISCSQERVWFFQGQYPGSCAYNLPGRMELHHAIDIALIRKTLFKLIERHESFRTFFKEVDGHPVQVIEKTSGVPLKVLDISSLNKEKKQLECDKIFSNEARTPFDLSRTPLFRTLLVKLAPNHFTFIFNLHHIISDGWSQEILKREFWVFYNTPGTKQNFSIAPLPIQYKDFVSWQRRRLNAPEFEVKAHDYWLRCFQGEFPAPRLPYDFPVNQQDNSGGWYRYVIDNKIKNELKNFAFEHKTSLFLVMFSTFNLAMSNICEQQEIVYRVARAGREHVSLHHVMGYFVNPVIVKINVNEKDNENFIDLLQRVHSIMMEAFRYQEYPMELALKKLRVNPPEVTINFNMLNMFENNALKELDNFTAGHNDSIIDEKFTITLQVIEYKDGLEIFWRYKKAFFKPLTIEHMCSIYIELLRQITMVEIVKLQPQAASRKPKLETATQADSH